jgi:Na+/H+ antiporter NhaC
MLKAERAARLANDIDTEKFENSEISSHGIDALIPLLTLIIGTIIGLFATGYDISVWHDTSLDTFSKLSAIIGNANSYIALLWSSLISLLSAIIITLLRNSMEFGKIMEEMVEGFKIMFNAVLILTMAWSIALVTKDMHTAEFVSQLLLQWSISPLVVPALTFLLAALIGFSTGTSWGTMAILYPLILPASWMLSMDQGFSVDATMPLFYNVVASVMAGAVMGDHCSPISDTTIMSSMASGCNHLQHVNTQLPYALTVGAVALLIGVLPTALGLPSWLAFTVAIAILAAIVRFVGSKIQN